MIENKKVWAEIKEKKTHRLIRIIYNPYKVKAKKIIEDWIIPEARNDVYVVFTS